MCAYIINIVSCVHARVYVWYVIFFFLEIKCLNKSKTEDGVGRVIVGQPFHRLGRLALAHFLETVYGPVSQSLLPLPLQNAERRRGKKAKAKVKKMKWG